MDYDSYDAILHFIFRSTQGDAWFKPSEENVSAGVCIRLEPGQFRVFPYENPFLAPFESAVRGLNPLVAVKVRSAAVHSALATIAEDASAIHVDADTRIQVLDSVGDLPNADKEQCGAFLRDERVLVVWSDELDQIVPLCREFNDKLMKYIWDSRPISHSVSTSIVTSIAPSTATSKVNLNEKYLSPPPLPLSEAVAVVASQTKKEDEKKARPWKFLGWSWTTSRTRDADVEKGPIGPAPRPIRLLAPFYGGAAAALSLFFISSGFSIILSEFKLDHGYARFALMVTAPFLVCISLFFSMQIVVNICMMIGPVAQYHENSRYYSAQKPARNPDVDSHLPHITIEMPVYKESLEDTISHSVFHIKKAMQTYARQGGSSSILIHDDGLQIIDEEERQKRIEFYSDHGIGWVARPPHSSAPDGFKRAGRFKKASNMNFGLQLSLLMEKHILALEASEKSDDQHMEALEEKALEMAIEEMYESTGKRWKPWASNARALRVGDIILLVDSDTVVPEDCLRDAAREMAECPDVGIIQHESDVLQVAFHYFENGIAQFTRRINKSISLGCANGEIAPFVGHNAFLRWSALQEAAFVDTDGEPKIWSENNVSEDFDMALRLQLKGYVIRWATYSEGGFKEGVSLTVDDELNRWQKYAYGCNELIFNPLKDWWRLGPINKKLRTFLWSAAPVHYKLSMMAYMFSYYGLAAAAFLSILNYFLLGFSYEVDGFYLKSFEIWLACMVLFTGAGNVGFTFLEYRIGHRDLWSSFLENFMSIPFLFFFFSGLSIHLSTALLAHLFSYNITWGATAKEVERSNFWVEVPKIWKRYWPTFLFCFSLIVGMAILATPLVSPEWQITADAWGVILPLSITAGGHILFPIVLNPWLMIFSF
ncbi:CAZyme family GT2 [Agaricus bisporus var. burnettii]|uniref:CAZyme family GT2 n=1 Tax=Agaricus bisporus var. burnettii TaxID=192524 RepID=A0A8H7C2A6_AGABI|nr:CAZyme family GT2 [Agaricus bisporus var. burnettii]